MFPWLQVTHLLYFSFDFQIKRSKEITQMHVVSNCNTAFSKHRNTYCNFKNKVRIFCKLKEKSDSIMGRPEMTSPNEVCEITDYISSDSNRCFTMMQYYISAEPQLYLHYTDRQHRVTQMGRNRIKNQIHTRTYLTIIQTIVFRDLNDEFNCWNKSPDFDGEQERETKKPEAHICRVFQI